MEKKKKKKEKKKNDRNWDGSIKPDKINLKQLDRNIAEWLRKKLLTESIHSANNRNREGVENCNQIILRIYQEIGDW